MAQTPSRMEALQRELAEGPEKPAWVITRAAGADAHDGSRVVVRACGSALRARSARLSLRWEFADDENGGLPR